MSALSTTSTVPAGSTWTADPVHSSVGFAVKHMVVATFRGRFETFDAMLRADDDGTLHLSGRVRSDSIVVKDPDLAAHLAAPDFFATANHPEIAFASTLVRADDGRLDIDGELTIKGHTRPLRARGSITEPHETLGGLVKLGIQLDATVDRTEYGLTWNAPLPKGGFALADEVTLQAELELVEA